MTVFITSDSHFNHNNILDFEDRPFKTLDEMYEGMVTAWNDVVMKNDTVYHLGDFSFGNVHQWRKALNDLRGNIILIKGNHDKSKIIKTMMNEELISECHPLGIVLKRDKMILNLSHYPMMIGARPRNFSIHGHLHSDTSGFTNHVNVGVDNGFAKSLGKPFGTPITMDELILHLEEINPLVEEEHARTQEQKGK